MAPGAELATAYVTLVSSARGLGQDIVDQAAAGGAGAEAEGQRAGSRFASAFGAAALAVGGIVLAGTKGLFEVGAVFDTVSDTIRIGTGKSGEALAGLVDSAKAVGQSVPANFEQVGSTITALNQRLGLSGATLETVASQYLEAGRILGQDVDIQSSTAAFSAFGIEGDAVIAAMDQLFGVSQATGVGMNELAGAVQANAPALQNLGFGFGETASLVGSLDKAGLNATAVMGSMSKGLVALAKDGEEPQEAFRRITDEIGVLIAKGDTAAAIDLASGVFGTRGASQFVGAVQSGALALDDLVGSVATSGDSIIALGAETSDFAEQWELFKNRGLVALEPLGAKVFGALGSFMGKAAEQVGPITARISAGASSVFAVVGPAAKAALSSIGSTIGPVLAQLGAAFGPVFATLGPVFAQLVPVFAQIMPLFSPFSLLMKSLQPVLPQLATSISTIAVAVGTALAGALAAVAPLLPQIADVFGRIAVVIAQGVVAAVDALVPVALMLIDAFVALLPTVVQLVESVLPPLAAIFVEIAPLIAALATVIADVLAVAIEALLPVVTTVFQAIGPIIDAALQIVKGIIEVVTGIISGDWSKVWQGIKDFLGGIWEGIKAVISGAVEIVKAVLSGAWELIKSTASTAWEAVRGFIVDPLQAAWDFITGAFQGIVTALYGVWNAIKIGVEVALGALYAIIIKPFQDAWNWVKDTFTGIVSSVQKIWDSIKAIFTQPLKATVEATVNGDLLGLRASSGLPGAAHGTVVAPRRGGSPWLVGEGGEQEIISPTSLMRAVVDDAFTAHAGQIGGAGAGMQVTIYNEGPDMSAEAFNTGYREWERRYAFA